MKPRPLDAIAGDVDAVADTASEWIAQSKNDAASARRFKRTLRALMRECEALEDPAAELVHLRARSVNAGIIAATESPEAAIVAFEKCADVAEAMLAAGPEQEVAREVVCIAMRGWVDAAVMSIGTADLLGTEERLNRAEQVGATGVPPNLVVSWLNAWAALAIRRGRASETYARAEAAYAAAAEYVPDRDEMITATSNLANACWQLGELDRARELAKQVLQHPRRNASEELSARTTLALSHSDPHEAVQLLSEVAEQHRLRRQYVDYAEAALAIGAICQTAGYVPQAQQWLASASAVTPDPGTAAACHVVYAATLPARDPQVAQLHARARGLVRHASPATRVLIDILTTTYDDEPTAEWVDGVIPLALIMDMWRIEIPWGFGRQLWPGTLQSSAMEAVLRTAADLGRTEVLVALVAHLCAIAPRPDGHQVSPPPPVLLAGADPLHDAANRAADLEFRVRSAGAAVDLGHGEVGVLDLMVAWRGDIFLCWRSGGSTAWQTAIVDGASVREPLERVSADFAADGHVLTDLAAEAAAMEHLGRALLPPALLGALADVGAQGAGGDRPRMRIRVDGELAGLCWGLLVCSDSGQRLLQQADLLTVAPFGLPTANAAEPVCAGVVSVIDPKVPGVAVDSALGSLFGAGASRDAWQLRLAERGGVEVGPDGAGVGGQGSGGGVAPLVHRTDQDRAWLAAALAHRPARLICVAHAGSVPTDAGFQVNEPALFLCCRADAPGHAAPAVSFRPLAASDLLDPELFDWFPPRVALLGCASGADARLRDSFGLTHALLSRGADLVSALRWPVPTLQWYLDRGAGDARTAGGSSPDEPVAPARGESGDGDPLVQLTFAVDHAHDQSDPVAELGDWQRAALARWLAGGALVDSPIGWGALHTVVRFEG